MLDKQALMNLIMATYCIIVDETADMELVVPAIVFGAVGTALEGMLASCAPGLLVVNIDNGYGAAMAAIRILKP